MSTTHETVQILGQVLSNRVILTRSDVVDGWKVAAILSYGLVISQTLDVGHGLSKLKFLKCLIFRQCRANSVVHHFFEQNKEYQRVQRAFLTIS